MNLKKKKKKNGCGPKGRGGVKIFFFPETPQHSEHVKKKNF